VCEGSNVQFAAFPLLKNFCDFSADVPVDGSFVAGRLAYWPNYTNAMARPFD